ncbi:hypothetical protein Syun_027506 [Stephania yunnanensis]|uniref:Uncharacterized protein n=1 Tax=Stephania yunnanensis TaxID=152371 RepID=A0AAP0HRB4_9MAGN
MPIQQASKYGFLKLTVEGMRKPIHTPNFALLNVEARDGGAMGVFGGKREKPLHGNIALDMEKCKIVEKPTSHPELKAKQGSTAMPNTTRAEFKKDIIGSIVEHGTPVTVIDPTIQSALPSQPTSSKPSKPVSRFKMQRAGR